MCKNSYFMGTIHNEFYEKIKSIKFSLMISFNLFDSKPWVFPLLFHMEIMIRCMYIYTLSELTI